MAYTAKIIAHNTVRGSPPIAATAKPTYIKKHVCVVVNLLVLWKEELGVLEDQDKVEDETGVGSGHEQQGATRVVMVVVRKGCVN